MAIREISLPNAQSFPVSNQILAVIGMIFSPMLAFAMFFYSTDFSQPNPKQVFASLCGVLYLLGAMATATAMRNLRVTENGKGAAILYFVQMLGLFLAMWCDALEYAAPRLKDTWIFFITDMAYPFSHLLMIVVGVAVVRAGVWRGWKRIPAFLIGFGLPLFIILGAIFGRGTFDFTFPLFTTAGFFLLGLAVFTTKTENSKKGV